MLARAACHLLARCIEGVALNAVLSVHISTAGGRIRALGTALIAKRDHATANFTTCVWFCAHRARDDAASRAGLCTARTWQAFLDLFRALREMPGEAKVGMEHTSCRATLSLPTERHECVRLTPALIFVRSSRGTPPRTGK